MSDNPFDYEIEMKFNIFQNVAVPTVEVKPKQWLVYAIIALFCVGVVSIFVVIIDTFNDTSVKTTSNSFLK